MRNLNGLMAGLLLLVALPAAAELELFKDYELSDAVWNISTIKVKANAGEHYLEGLKATWVRANEA